MRARSFLWWAWWPLTSIIAALLLGAPFQPLKIAHASSPSSVTITPRVLTAGTTTAYDVAFTTTSGLRSGGTITIDWYGDGVSEGVIQQLLPATVTFNAGAPTCGATASVVNGNTVITLNDSTIQMSPASCAILPNTPVQLSISNVRNPKVGSSSSGALFTSTDTTATPDPGFYTWTSGGLNVTAQGTPGVGPTLAYANATDTLAVNYYPMGLEMVTFSATRGSFTVGNATVLNCADFSPCDADGSLNRIITVMLMGDGTTGATTITATAHIPSGRTFVELTTTTTLTFVGPPATVSVTATPTTITGDGATPSAVTATVQDASAHPVADGTAVTFSLSLGTLQPTSATTIAGVASTTLVSTSSGTASITARAGGVTSPATTVTVTPGPQVIQATSTGVYCITFSGPATPVTGFPTLFAPGITAVNILQLPAGNYLSWFPAAPSLATAQSLSPGQTFCVAGPVGSNVFAQRS